MLRRYPAGAAGAGGLDHCEPPAGCAAGASHDEPEAGAGLYWGLGGAERGGELDLRYPGGGELLRL